MSAASITPQDAAKMVSNLEANGRPVPPALRKAAGGAANPTPPPPAAPTPGPDGVPVPQGKTPGQPKNTATKTPPPAKPTSGGSRPAATTGARGPAGGRGPSGAQTLRSAPSRPRAPRSSTRTRAPRGRGLRVGKSFRSLVKSPGTLGGGDGGGLLLAFWLYPIVLSVIQHGASGPGLWLRAKFLNQGTAPAPLGKVQGAAPTPSTPGAVPGLTTVTGSLSGLGLGTTTPATGAPRGKAGPPIGSAGGRL